MGNKKTKTKLIVNELDFAEGDSLPLKDLMPAIERNKRYLINTLLFNQVTIKISRWDEQDVYISIQVKESWYIFPLPQFELADRNFNVWWVRHKRNLSRANLGMWLLWRNISGYNDLLKIIVQFGYTRKFELDYTLPPMGRFRKFGFNVNALYSDNKEIAFNTGDNRLLFYNNYDAAQGQFQRIRGRLRFYYRRTLFETQKLELSYLQLNISDTAAQLNPDFFGANNKTQRSFNLKYNYTLDKRDIQAYPLSGYFIRANLSKEGLGIFNDINRMDIQADLGYYCKVGKVLSLGAALSGRFNFIRNQPAYYNNKALGYWDNYVRGYQYYVIDGQDYLTLKSDVNFKVLDINIPLIKKPKLAYLNAMPLKIHLRYHLDFGYVQDNYYYQNNRLSNTDLWGTGIGADIILYAYNIIFQIDYTWNKNGTVGLYFRYKFNF